jgi:2-methylisocitrate lyase-like PEP mutase family enzyme
MNSVANQKAKAEAFAALHHGKHPLLLPNVWDVASARMIEEAGLPAVATTSAGIAFAMGYPDGQEISRDEMLAVVARIAKAVKVPVTADVEAGYGLRPEDAANTVFAVVEAGAVGINLEDGTGDAADVYLAAVGSSATRYDETIRRLAAYRDAGAQCVFAPGIGDVPTIQRLVTELHCPLNILAGPGSPSIPELTKLGVARVSLGSSAMRATLGLLTRIASELQTTGTYAALAGAPSHGEINKLIQ